MSIKMSNKSGDTLGIKDQNCLLRINLQTWLALLALGVALWLILTSIQLIAEVLLILFISWLLLLAIRPIMDFLARWHIPRLISVLSIYLGILGVIVLITSLLTPAFFAEINRIQSQGPQMAQQAMTQMKNIPIPKQLLSNVDKIVPTLTQGLDALISPLLTTITGLGRIAIDVFVALILTLFMSVDPRVNLARFIQDWSPSQYRDSLTAIYRRINGRLTRWFWSQIAIALYLATALSLGLAVLKVPFAFSIGLTGGVLEIVPYLGGVVAVILAIFSALTVSPWLALWVVILYIIVVEVESHIIAPLFYGRAVGMHPVVVLIALVLGLKAGGIIGVFLAVPVAVVLISLLQEIRTHLIPHSDPAT